eukprot:3941922-Rhodomonas_salina.1
MPRSKVPQFLSQSKGTELKRTLLHCAMGCAVFVDFPYPISTHNVDEFFAEFSQKVVVRCCVARYCARVWCYAACGTELAYAATHTVDEFCAPLGTDLGTMLCGCGTQMGDARTGETARRRRGSERMLLHSHGTERAYAATLEGGDHLAPCTPPMIAPPQSSERTQCMMPAGYVGDTQIDTLHSHGTELAYDAMQCAVLSWRMVLRDERRFEQCCANVEWDFRFDDDDDGGGG